MRHEPPKSRAVFIHGADIKAEEDGCFAVFEERRSSAVAGVAYPTKDSRSAAACKRALDTAAGCFLERPSDSDTALEMIAQIVDEETVKLQESEREFKCSYAMLYIFKGRARVYAAGHSAVIFFENGQHVDTWYGDGVPAGTRRSGKIKLPERHELEADCRFVFLAGEDPDTVRSAAGYIKESSGEDTEGMKAYMSDRRIAYVNLYLPERKKGIMGLRGF